MPTTRQIEQWAPWLLTAATADRLAGDLLAVRRLRLHLSQRRSRSRKSLVEYAGPIAVHAWQTFWTTMAGFAIGVAVGLLLGVLVGSSRFIYSALYPLLVAFNSIPKAAFVPILVVWFGIGTRARRSSPRS